MSSLQSESPLRGHPDRSVLGTAQSLGDHSCRRGHVLVDRMILMRRSRSPYPCLRTRALRMASMSGHYCCAMVAPSTLDPQCPCHELAHSCEALAKAVKDLAVQYKSTKLRRIILQLHQILMRDPGEVIKLLLLSQLSFFRSLASRALM